MTTNILALQQMEEDEMGGTCSTSGREEKYVQDFGGEM